MNRHQISCFVALVTALPAQQYHRDVHLPERSSDSRLDATDLAGNAVMSIFIPPIPALIGFRQFTSAVTVDCLTASAASRTNSPL